MSSRIIKFRAWDTKRNKMLESVNFQEGMPVELGYQFYNQPTNGRELVLMQYTGLHDKNGKEIYEGDIVFDPSENGGKKIVVWNESLAKFEFNSFLGYSLAKGSTEKCEVIGNIYENP